MEYFLWKVGYQINLGNEKQYQKPTLNKKVEKLINTKYLEQIEFVEELTGKNLNHWK